MRHRFSTLKLSFHFDNSLTYNRENGSPGWSGIGLYNFGWLPGTLSPEHFFQIWTVSSCRVWYQASAAILPGTIQLITKTILHFKVETLHSASLICYVIWWCLAKGVLAVRTLTQKSVTKKPNPNPNPEAKWGEFMPGRGATSVVRTWLGCEKSNTEQNITLCIWKILKAVHHLEEL